MHTKIRGVQKNNREQQMKVKSANKAQQTVIPVLTPGGIHLGIRRFNLKMLGNSSPP